MPVKTMFRWGVQYVHKCPNHVRIWCTTGLRALRRKQMTFWSAGLNCGNYLPRPNPVGDETKCRCRYQISILSPYKAGHLDCRMVCFTTQGPEARSM